ncbi:Disintegrin and metalloproteinase domain-containing protein 10 [Geranomyces variabilis]|nr:Disintegrin and metalloproteinase domain-containing protein 10 [Geranomyces variabilis]
MRLLLTLALLLLHSINIHALLVHKRDDLDSIFTRYHHVTTLSHTRRSISSGESVITLHLALNDTTLTLHVAPNTPLVAGTHFANSDNPPPSDAFLAGTVDGATESTVRLTRMREGLYEGTARWVDAAGTARSVHFEVVPAVEDDSTGQMIAYTDKDVIDPFDGRHTCGEVDAPVLAGIPDIAAGNFLHARAAADGIIQPDGCMGPDCLTDYDPSTAAQLHRRATVSGRGRDCAIAVVADIKFSSTFGADTETVALSLFNDIDGVYHSTLNVRTPLNYLYVVRSVNDTTGFGKPANTANAILSQLVEAISGKKLPKLPSTTCLVHVLTVQDFNPTLGLAYVGKSGALGGICSSGGYNAGISTPAYGTTLLSRATYVTTITHEVGHGMGSNHDSQRGTAPYPASLNPAACNPPNAPYIMYPASSTSINDRLFSSCSLTEIGAALDSVGSCFIARNSLGALQANATTPKWYAAKTVDQCAARPNLPSAPAGGYTDCPYAVDSSYVCTLVCMNPSGGGCVKFPGPLNKTDGTMCGAFNDQSTDPYEHIPDLIAPLSKLHRRDACCNAFGLPIASQNCTAKSTSTQAGIATAAPAVPASTQSESVVGTPDASTTAADPPAEATDTPTATPTPVPETHGLGVGVISGVAAGGVAVAGAVAFVVFRRFSGGAATATGNLRRVASSSRNV